MNTSNKLGSFIGSLVIAFTITLILPSMANAHGYDRYGTDGSSCYNGSNTQDTGDQAANYKKYKKLAQKYLDAYYRCYDYTYYRYYVYYMKKANACKPKQAKNNCTKYKILADKYLAAYQRCGYYIYYRYYLYYMNLYKQACDQNTDTTGKVCGLVFEDTNGNGIQDDDEPEYAGAKVTITDSEGNTFTVTTDAEGKYCQDGVAEGDATVEVDPSSLPANSDITTENPTTINVEAGKKNQAGKDGFELPQTPTGSVCGTVYVDVNKNGLKDYGEPGIADITVNITDSNGKVTSVETGADGKYCANGIAEGKAIVDVDENDPDMPADSEPTLNPDPSPVNVIANKHNDAGIDGYYNPNSGLGCLCTIVYIDKNRDGKYKYDDGDRGIKGVTVTLVDSKGTTHTLQTNASGVITAVLPLGEVTMSIDENDPHIPADMVLLEGQGKNPVTFENTSRQNSPTHYGFQLD